MSERDGSDLKILKRFFCRKENCRHFLDVNIFWSRKLIFIQNIFDIDSAKDLS